MKFCKYIINNSLAGQGRIIKKSKRHPHMIERENLAEPLVALDLVLCIVLC